ncbi:MAG: hydroxymethylbilane synthase [Chloroflexota bacterium]|nr:hydroxymethylbilane synthase [Chloroflexota bacterium]
MSDVGLIRLGTRGSKLALRQADWATNAVQSHFPGLRVERVVIRVESDRQPDRSIPEIGERGIFTRDIESSLLEGRIDIAVHSLKDLPSEDVPGLSVVATSPREDPRDALLTLDGRALEDLRPGAVVGTSSLRRCALVLESRPDLSVRPIRGNIDTRLRKLYDHEYDAVVMAAAALNRLHEAVPAQLLDSEHWIPAVAQGIIGIQARSEDRGIGGMLARISDPEAFLCARIERLFLQSLGGGCSVPVGGLATLRSERVTLRAFVGSPDGERTLRAERTVSVVEADRLGGSVAEALREQGAESILAKLRASVPIVRGE